MPDTRLEQRLALHGGLKAVSTIEGKGKGKPKIGIEEFLAVAERFGFTKPTLRKIKEIVPRGRRSVRPRNLHRPEPVVHGQGL